MTSEETNAQQQPQKDLALAATDRPLPETARIDTSVDLRPGTYSILEPDPLSCSPCDPALDALCLVPGLSFDDQGYRLGYGKGYYDRFLASFTGLAIGLCYFRDLTRKLPRGRFDFPVHTMVTERAVMAARAIT